jgi:hypothetical protein
MASPKCTCCGQTIRQPKAAKVFQAYAPELDKATLSDAELHAYLKKIGCREDVRFFLRVASPIRPDLRAAAESLLTELETRASKPADYKALNAIRDAYRIDRNRARPMAIFHARLSRRLTRARLRQAA